MGEDEGGGLEGGVEGAGGDGCDVEEGASADEGLTCRAGGAGLLEDGRWEVSDEELGAVNLALRFRA